MVNMKILFVCAGGMSTGLIVKKMEKWASENGKDLVVKATGVGGYESCLLYTSPSPRDGLLSRMPSSA